MDELDIAIRRHARIAQVIAIVANVGVFVLLIVRQRYVAAVAFVLVWALSLWLILHALSLAKKRCEKDLPP